MYLLVILHLYTYKPLHTTHSTMYVNNLTFTKCFLHAYVLINGINRSGAHFENAYTL